MNSSGCASKKQKLNNFTSVLCNDSIINNNQYGNKIIAKPEMCFFCFDVLYSYLHNLEPPKSPDFCNDPLYV